MGGIKKQVQRGVNLLKHGEYKTRDEIKAKEAGKAAVQVERDKDAMFANAQMPDSDTIRRNERRKAARRRGSRVETILTDRLGPDE